MIFAAKGLGAGEALISHMPLLIGILICGVSALVLFGGSGNPGKAMGFVVPVMSLLYLGLCVSCLVIRREYIGSALSSILKNAFSPSSALGGAAGLGISTAVRRGVERGVFTHEAGMGSSAIAHADADNTPEKQALLGIFEVFADTFVICTLTALVILTAPIEIPYGNETGMALSAAAFSVNLGEIFSTVALAVCVLLFAAASIWAWGLYGSRCAEYLFGKKAVKVYLIVFCAAMLRGAYMKLDLVWKISEYSNAAMAAPNLISLFIFTKKTRTR
jgi:AGCS family alanine or glycine:cation symporter